MDILTGRYGGNKGGFEVILNLLLKYVALYLERLASCDIYVLSTAWDKIINP